MTLSLRWPRLVPYRLYPLQVKNVLFHHYHNKLITWKTVISYHTYFRFAIMLITATGNTAVPEAGPSSHSKHATLDFQVPPITIHPPDEGDTSGSASSRMALSRRVQSMQPAARKSLDENRSSVAITRSASEYRKFDGWPWAGAAKNTRRRSMPLTNSFNEGSPAANGASSRTIYPRVFSPPP